MSTMQEDKLNYNSISEEIDTVLAEVLGKYLVRGNPTKHGGLRFLDTQSAKTFGFERTRYVEHDGSRYHLLIISAPAEIRLSKAELLDPAKVQDARERAQKRLTEAIESGPHHGEIHKTTVRPSPDPGKQKKLFIEVQYRIPTFEVVGDEVVLAYAREKGLTASEAVRRKLREYIIPRAEETMDHLMEVVRKDQG